MDFKHLVVPNSCNRFNLFQFEVKLGSRSKSLQAIEHSATACLLLVSNHVVCPSTFGHFFSENFKRPIPALKISDIRIHKDLLRPSTTQHPKDSQSTARKSAAHVRTPSVTSSEPLPKRPENPSGATTASVGRVHRGPRRDQLLDHGGMAFLSRVMQRRLASGAEDATAVVEKQSV